jgi:hypothetical protein
MYPEKQKKFVGVIPPISFKNLWYPKQLLLMFDKLAVDLANNLSDYENRIITQSRLEIDWLVSEGLLTTLSGMIADNKPGMDKTNVTVSGSFFLPSSIANHLNRFAQTTFKGYNGLQDLRTIASRLRELESLDAVAVGLPDTPIEVDKKADRDTVIKITLNQFPIPTNTTSWENILDFKQNSKSIEQFTRLKSWINKISTKELKAFEVEDELQEIIHAYEHEMKVSKMNCTDGALEVIVATLLKL